MEKANWMRWVDPYSILVINQQGKIRRLYCPFQVKCISAVEGIPVNTWCYVDRVSEGRREKLLYDINGRELPFHHFEIYVRF